MADLLRRFGKNGLAIAASILLSRMASFVLMPFLTAAIPEADYGIQEMFVVLAQLTALLGLQGVPSGLFREYAYSARTPEDKRRAVATGFRFVALSSLLFAGGLALCAAPISRALTGESRYAGLLVLVVLTYVFSNLRNVCAQILRADLRSKEFVVLYCGEFLVCLLLNVWFVLVLDEGIAGLIYSNLIGAAMAFLLGVYFVPQGLAPAFDRTRLRAMWRFGVPLVPLALALYLLNFVDRFFFVGMLGHEHGLEVNGVYGKGMQIALILEGALLFPFNAIWPSIFYDVAKRDSGARELGRCATWFLAVAFFLAVGLAVCAHPLATLMLDVRYHEAWTVVPILVFAFALLGFSEVTKVGMFVAGRTSRMPLLVLVALGVNCLLNWLLIPWIGMPAAAWSSFGAYGVLALLAGIVSQRCYPLHWEWARLAKVVVAAALCLVVNSWFPLALPATIGERVVDLLLRGALLGLVLYPLLLLLFGFFAPGELAALRALLRRGGPAALAAAEPGRVTGEPPSG